jgi:2-keto-4-pentenoate hydratase/2-oxohepta-3-ene-1,7-dioic acid hydratase in catechol pathway
MKLVTYAHHSATSCGVILRDGRVLDLKRAAGAARAATLGDDLRALIATGEPALALARTLSEEAETGRHAGAILAAGSVKLLAPIPRPAKNVFCVGRNYLDHIAESDRVRGADTKAPEFPQFFTKPPTAVIGPDETFVRDPAVSSRMDYEVELGVVIGPGGKDIPAERALDHVFGYTIVNDMTARDLQRRHDQWFKGKGLDRSCPMGPCIVTRDEIGDPRTLELSLTVNGEERQHATVSQMIFDIPNLIQSLSAGMTLEAADILSTGTPAGVGFAMNPPRFLQPGDEVVCKISRIGTLTTRIGGR